MARLEINPNPTATGRRDEAIAAGEGTAEAKHGQTGGGDVLDENHRTEDPERPCRLALAESVFRHSADHQEMGAIRLVSRASGVGMLMEEEMKFKVVLGTGYTYRKATIVADVEQPDRSVGFPGSVTVEGIEIEPQDARDLLIELVQAKLETALLLAKSLDMMDDVRIDL